MSIFIVLLLCNGFTVFYPSQFTASGFLTTYLGIPIFLIIYLGHKIYKGRKDRWLYSPNDVDLVTQVDEVEADAQVWAALDKQEQERKGMSHGPWKVLKKISLLWQ